MDIGANNGKHTKSQLSATQEIICQELAYKPFTNKREEDIAKEYNINRTTIWRWKSIPAFNDRLIEISKEIHKSHLPNFNAALLSCLNSSNEKSILKAIEIYYRSQGLFTDNQEITIKDAAAPSIDDILKEIEGL